MPDPVTTIAWRIWHIGNLCLRGYVIYFFEDVPDLGDRHEWPGTVKEGVQALAEGWKRFISRIAALGEKRLEPMGRARRLGRRDVPEAHAARFG